MDGYGWVCAGCRSINRASASRCYSCRAKKAPLDLSPTTTFQRRPALRVAAPDPAPPRSGPPAPVHGVPAAPTAPALSVEPAWPAARLDALLNEPARPSRRACTACGASMAADAPVCERCGTPVATNSVLRPEIAPRTRHAPAIVAAVVVFIAVRRALAGWLGFPA